MFLIFTAQLFLSFGLLNGQLCRYEGSQQSEALAVEKQEAVDCKARATVVMSSESWIPRLRGWYSPGTSVPFKPHYWEREK